MGLQTTAMALSWYIRPRTSSSPVPTTAFQHYHGLVSNFAQSLGLQAAQSLRGISSPGREVSEIVDLLRRLLALRGVNKY